MKNNYSEALVEVNEVLKYTDPNLTCKIPDSFKKYILDNMSKTYKFSISENDNPNNIALMIETKTILGLIYRNYFCTAEEKKRLLELENVNLLKQKTDISLNQNFDNQTINTSVDNSFSTKNNNGNNAIIDNYDTKTSNESHLDLIEKKQKWYITLLEKLLNKLKGLN